ncbi:MAG TPA: hypothetical protein VFB92_26830 [Vicinamibacterales bacterium]|nr:hypothetical protein [Vicinamibacterales bacterium]
MFFWTIRRLRSESVASRKAALRKLQEDLPRLVRAWIHALKADGFDHSSARSVGDLCRKEIDALRHGLQHRNAWTRNDVASALVETLTAFDLGAVLVELLDSPVSRDRAAQALAKLGDQRAIEPLLKLVKAGSGNRIAVDALLRLSSEPEHIVVAKERLARIEVEEENARQREAERTEEASPEYDDGMHEYIEHVGTANWHR